jgi:hypothetical protein
VHFLGFPPLNPLLALFLSVMFKSLPFPVYPSFTFFLADFFNDPSSAFLGMVLGF